MYGFVCLCVCVCGLRMCTNSMTASYLAVSGRLARGLVVKERLALLLLSSVFAAAQVEAWLKARAAAAGSRWTCWRSQECSAPAPSWVARGRP